MNRTPELLAELRAEIMGAPTADLPAIIGQVEGLKAEAFARLFMPQPVQPRAEEEVGEELIDVDEAAALLGMSSRWVRDHQGDLPRVTLPGSAVRFSRKRLDAYIKRRAYG